MSASALPVVEDDGVAYHPERYVRDELGEGLELVDFAPGGAPEMRQDVALFRNPG